MDPLTQTVYDAMAQTFQVQQMQTHVVTSYPYRNLVIPTSQDSDLRDRSRNAAMDATRQEKREREHTSERAHSSRWRDPLFPNTNPTLGAAGRPHDPEALSLEPIFIGKAGLGWMHALYMS